MYFFCEFLSDIIEQAFRMPRGQEKFMCIADLKGWGYSNSDVRAYIAALDIMQVCVSALQAYFFTANVRS